MGDLATLSVRTAGIGQSLTRNASRLKQEVAKVVAETLVRATPVDTGVARSNWIATAGEPDDETVVPAHAPGRHLGIGETANAEETLKLIEDVLESSSSKDTLYLQNNVEYIEQLNNGSSKQAPAAFIQQAMMVGQAKARNPGFSLVDD